MEKLDKDPDIVKAVPELLRNTAAALEDVDSGTVNPLFAILFVAQKEAEGDVDHDTAEDAMAEIRERCDESSAVTWARRTPFLTQAKQLRQWAAAIEAE